MPNETATSQTAPQAPAQESAPQAPGKVTPTATGQANPETTAQKLAKGFAQMTGAEPSKTGTPQAEAQEQPRPAADQAPPAPETTPKGDDKPKEDKPSKGEGELSPEEKRRRTEQGAGDRARHQQELEAQRQKQREAAEKRRKEMLGLDDELLGQETRRQLETQAMQEQLIAQVKPRIEQEVHTNTRVMVATELIATLGDEALQNQVLARSADWQSPADFYRAYNHAVEDRAIQQFKNKELPKLLEEARKAARNEAHAEQEETPKPQLDGGTPPARTYRTTGERLNAGLEQMRKRK